MTLPTLYSWVPTESLAGLTGQLTLQPTGALGLVWMTTAAPASLSAPLADGEMTRVTIDDTRSAETWLSVQGEWPLEQWADLELDPRARPEFWLISRVPVPVSIG